MSYTSKVLPLLFASFFFINASAQSTIGLTQLEEGSMEGYTFFSPFSGTKAYLVDQCGQLVNVWDRGTRPGLSAYFLDNGLMLRTYKVDPEGPFTSASNAGGLELVDWDNNTVWSYEFNTPTSLSHHDAVYMPNGHILILTWDLVFTEELIELGRDPNEIAEQGFMWSEHVLEVEPVGSNDINIVWEWQIKDHYVQDFDPTKQGFGIVSEHPELFDINLPELNSSNSNSTRDWNHFNAIDYNPALDQILISTRNSDEIWILDHSTTTAEAAGHTGGVYGRGGDILYRWGNASAYDRAPVDDQKLFGQHGVNWIRDGLDDAGKIMIYNNGNGRPGPDFSQVDVITPPQDMNGGYPPPETEPFGPETTDWTYGDMPGENFYSAFLSNAIRLPNGNTLVNAGSIGTIFEVTPDRQVVWEYIIPLSGDFPLSQGQSPSNNATFRAYKYPADYPGFEGIDLESGDLIENGGNPIECMLLSSSSEELVENEAAIQYLPGSQSLRIEGLQNTPAQLFLFNVAGQLVFKHSLNSIPSDISLPNLAKGIYGAQLIIPNQGRQFYKLSIY
jgi:hypothetical protein